MYQFSPGVNRYQKEMLMKSVMYFICLQCHLHFGGLSMRNQKSDMEEVHLENNRLSYLQKKFMNLRGEVFFWRPVLK